MSLPAPIALFVYKRLYHTQQTVESLKNNSLSAESELFIYSDNAKTLEDQKAINEVRKYIREIAGFKKINIIERDKNLGLANSIIDGVTTIINRFGKIIVLEDDLICSPFFLKFMNEALVFYEQNDEIFSITGYKHPIEIPRNYHSDVFVSPRPSSWGWGTWLDRWAKVDWDIKDFRDLRNSNEIQTRFNAGGKDLTPMLFEQMNGNIDSWAIRWAYFHFKKQGFCLYPSTSLLQNIGADYSGTHTKKTKKFNVELNNNKKEFKFHNNLNLNKEIIRQQSALYEPSLLRKLINKLKFQ